MKGLAITLIFWGLYSSSCAQVSGDSLQRLTSIAERIGVDSLQQSLLMVPDSLIESFQKIDSIRTYFNVKTDSIQKIYRQAALNIQSLKSKLDNSIDSLRRINLSTDQYSRKRDSLSQRLNTIESRFRSGLDSLKVKTIDRLNAVDLPPEFQEPLKRMTANVTDLNIQSDVINISSIDIPGYKLPQIEGIGNISSGVGKIGKLPQIETPLGDINQITGQAQAYQDDIENIGQGNLEDVQKLPEALESQASKIDGMDELQKQAAVIDGHKAQLDKLVDPKKSKDKAVEVAKNAAVDHFAGKGEQLKAAMETISKYKQKYSSVSSIKDLPKRPPNPMKGKPFIERLVPGLYFQYQQKDSYFLDANPYVGYRISGRFTAGTGWNHRFAYNKRYHSWDRRSKIFGPRGYVDFKLGKGFIAHLEGESMNTFVPSAIHGNPDTGQREWVWSTMTGIKKEYKIYKNLKGTALIQYNLFNRYYKAPYVDRLNSRIGFEYMLKKKKKVKK